jgi:cytochrome c peroxidase
MPSASITVCFAAGFAAAAALLAAPLASAATAADALAGYRALAAATPSAERGRQLFVNKHGRDWSCASCHGATPTQTGQHAGTGKPIAPLAPAFNAERFADAARTEKWFRRNCNDVLGRECSAAEKADVLAWLLTLQP